jgi:hypothetical protein
MGLDAKAYFFYGMPLRGCLRPVLLRALLELLSNDMPSKVSERAMRLLLVIDQGTECDWTTGKVSRYWISGDKYSEIQIRRLGESVVVGGGGDAQALKALERRGLTRQMGMPYAYAITEDGRLAIEKYLELKAG